MGTQRVSRHNGRAGKNGTYSSKHNDRKFQAEKAEHIDVGRMQKNVYWDYLHGTRTHAEQEIGDYPSFEEVEKQFYTERYSGFIAGQTERNRKSGHSNRNRTIDDLLKDKRVCPEETIYQIGKEGSETPASVLLAVIQEYHDRFNQQFGEHVHIIDWALHLDETTPHVHERHVFDMPNRYGEIEPKQEKALEMMGIPLPKPAEKSGKNNNRKMTFDAICRELFISVCKEHGLEIEETPIYGGKVSQEKNDFIIEAQRVKIEAQQAELKDLQTLQAQGVEVLSQQQLKISENQSLLVSEDHLIRKITEEAYDRSVKMILDTTVREVQSENQKILQSFKEKNTAPEKKLKPAIRDAITQCLNAVIELLHIRTDKIIAKVKQKILGSEVRTEHLQKMERALAPSIHEQLRHFRELHPGHGTQPPVVNRERETEAR